MRATAGGNWESDERDIRDKSESGVGETIRVVIHALLIALVIRTFLFQPFNIPSGSMKATLLVGDYLFVSKYSYGYSHYSIPLSPPLFSGRIFGSEPVARRHRGVPPAEGRLHRLHQARDRPAGRPHPDEGGAALHQRRAGQARADERFHRRGPLRLRGHRAVKRWKETLPNGVTYETLDCVDNGFYDNTNVYTVPPGHFFMMGDNRDNSTDSRVLSAVGYVPFENIVGRAQMIFFSIAEGEHAWMFWRWPTAVRWNRIFTIVR